MLCIVVCCPLQNNQDISHLVAFDGVHLGLGNIAQEYTTADILVEDKLWPPLTW